MTPLCMVLFTTNKQPDSCTLLLSFFFSGDVVNADDETSAFLIEEFKTQILADWDSYVERLFEVREMDADASPQQHHTVNKSNPFVSTP